MSYQEEPGRDYRAERDAAYTERNKVVAGLAAMVIKAGGRAWLADHQDKPGEDWDPEWRTVVFIDGPTGQLSWHLHDSDVMHFLFLPRGENRWDGHTSEEKYARIARLAKTQCRARWSFSPREDWICQLDADHAGAHQWPNPADTVT